MTIEVASASGQQLAGVTAVGVPVWRGEGGPEVAGGLPPTAPSVEIPEALDPEWCTRQGFEAKPGQCLVLRGRTGSGPTTVLLGMGPRTGSVTGGDAAGDPEADERDRWRRAGAAFIRHGGHSGTAAIVLPPTAAGGPGPDAVAALAEGAVLAAYRFTRYRATPSPGTADRLLIVPADGGGVADDAVIARGTRVAEAVATARDVINTPAADLTPTALGAWAASLLEEAPGVSVEVWDERRIAGEGLGALLAVAKGSTEPPRFIRAEYHPAEPLDEGGRIPLVVLVGKGITFDSGGLSLKTADGMTAMKTDMSGAACVLSTLSACGDLGVRVRVVALAPVTENMPGGSAMKPGDVVTARSGTTVEVLNTDAEGRLVLADALALAAELEPDAVIDVATLTGAVTVALGPLVAALYSNRSTLSDQIRLAAERAGEGVWPMPLVEEYRDHLDSDVADLKNIGRPGQAGSIVAALFLERFAGGVPWAHLDIAGTGRSSESTGVLSKGGTGFGVRTLLELLRTYGAGRTD